MNVNCKLKEILDDRGLSIRQVASDLDIHFESLRRLYHNETERLPKDLLAKLCEYLQIPLSDLIKLEE